MRTVRPAVMFCVTLSLGLVVALSQPASAKNAQPACKTAAKKEAKDKPKAKPAPRPQPKAKPKPKPQPKAKPAAKPHAKPAAKPHAPLTADQINARLAGLFAAHKYAACKPLLKQLLQMNPQDYAAWYNLACVYSRLGNAQQALRALAVSIQLGFRDVEHMEKDEDLAAIRNTTGFKLLDAGLRKALGMSRGSPKPAPAPQARPAPAPAMPRVVEPTHQVSQKVRKLLTLERQMARYFKEKQYDKARDVTHRMLEIDPDEPTIWYNLACAHARLDDIAEALACLSMAIDKGYVGFVHMENDPDLKVLRWTSTYKELLARRDEAEQKQADKLVAQLRQKFGKGYICEVDHQRHMVFATDVDRRTLEELKSYLTQYASIQWRDLFSHPFEEYIIIVVPKEWKNPMIGGYYNDAAHLLVCRSVGMVLTHEFTHALHFADQDALGQHHPTWIAEGLATLFETSRIENGRIVCEPNPRLNAVQALIAKGRIVPWGDLFKETHAQFMQNARACYPEVRYIMFYLYSKGLLKEWYDTYTDNYDQDPSGIQAMEKVFGGQDLDQIQGEWQKWVMKQKAPPLRLSAHHACLGVMLQELTDGLRIARLVPGGGAAKAGLKVGDVITKIDSQRVVDPSSLLAIIAGHAVGDHVTLEIRRDGKYLLVPVTLGAMPAIVTVRPPLPPKAKPKAQPKPHKAHPKSTGPAKPTHPHAKQRVHSFRRPLPGFGPLRWMDWLRIAAKLAWR